MTVSIQEAAGSPEAGCAEQPPGPFTLRSYQHLLRRPVPRLGTRAPGGQDARNNNDPVIDAIVVPTIRSAEQLRSAVKLALDTRCKLLTLHSHTFPGGLAPVLHRLERSAVPLAVRSSAAHSLLDLAAGLPQSLRCPSAADISRKRNIALLIGRACGWSGMLFLDDDIRGLNADRLRAAAQGLHTSPVVGLQVSRFLDASVVGHARSLTEGEQEPFISGGSLLVDPQRLTGFFPPVYHEDWLCIMNHIRLREVAVRCQVEQKRYNPFATPDRARVEEFGDILAYGLLWLIHSDRSDPAQRALAGQGSAAAGHDYWRRAMDRQFWQEVLSQRTVLLNDLANRLERRSEQDMSPLRSVRAARQRCSELQPQEFTSFVRLWVDARAAWQDGLSRLPQTDSVIKALDKLGLLHVVRTHEGNHRKVRAALARGRDSARQITKIRGLWSPLTEEGLDDTAPGGRHGMGRRH